MITAHVNQMGIVIRHPFAFYDNLTREQWDSLLTELKSQYIPAYYPYGKRCYVDLNGVVDGIPNQVRVVIYFTPDTVTLDESIPILQKYGITVFDVRNEPNEPIHE